MNIVHFTPYGVEKMQLQSSKNCAAAIERFS